MSCGLPQSKMQSSNLTEVEGCRLPDIDPFDKNAMTYFISMAPMTCDLEATLFTTYRDGFLDVVVNHDRGTVQVLSNFLINFLKNCDHNWCIVILCFIGYLASLLLYKVSSISLCSGRFGN